MHDTAAQNAFDESYERTLHRLQTASKRPDFSLETIQGELNALCVYEGHDWTGRGELKRAEIEGSALAYQIFLRRLKGDEA